MRYPRLFTFIWVLGSLYNKAMAQAMLNGGVNVTETYQMPPHTYMTVSENYSMNNFVNGEEYKIDVIEDAPILANNVQMAVNLYTILDDVQFTYDQSQGSTFTTTFWLPEGTPVGQTQLIKYRIYRKRLGIWDYQTTFFLYVAPICPYNVTMNNYYPYYAKDYEVGGNLTVTGSANPNGGNVEFDAGQSITLLPTFSTNLTGGGVFNMVIDGCGGSYRSSAISMSETQIESFDELNSEYKLFPNPAKSSITLVMPDLNEEKESEITIINVLGEVVYRSQFGSVNNIEINVNELKNGVYFMKIRSGDSFKLKRFVKE